MAEKSIEARVRRLERLVDNLRKHNVTLYNRHYALVVRRKQNERRMVARARASAWRWNRIEKNTLQKIGHIANTLRSGKRVLMTVTPKQLAKLYYILRVDHREKAHKGGYDAAR